MKTIKNILRLLLVSQVLTVSAYGQLNMKFKYLTADQGLSSNRITYIFRDSRDFLWVGTDLGLNKYDGYKVTQYVHYDLKKGTISNNNLLSIIEDTKKNLWAGTSNGLNLYNRQSDSFTVFKNIPGDPHSLNSDFILSMYVDKKGNLWILTGGNCLNLWVPEKRNFIRYPFQALERRYFSSAQTIAEDSRGNIWTTPYGDRLFCMDPKAKKFSTYSLGIKTSEKTLNNIYIDKQDKIWIGTRGAGLHSFDALTKKIEHFNIKADGTGTNKSLIHWIIPEDDKHLLIGTDQGGLNRLNLETKRFEYIEYKEGNNEGLNNNAIWTLYKDKEGILWVGTANGGVNYYNPKEYKFDLYRRGNTTSNPSSNIIGGFLEDSRGKIWIATDDSGINIWDPKTRKFSYLRHNPKNPHSLSGNIVRNFEEDRDGNIWAGTWDAGLNRFNRKTNTFDRFYPGINNSFSISGRNVWHLKRDHKGLIWLALTYVGIDVIDPKKGVVKRFKKDLINSYGLGSDITHLLVEDRQKNMWACTEDGLYRYDPEHDGFEAYKSFPDNDIRSFLQDSKGNLWVGSANKGVFLFDKKGRVLKHFDVGKGLANNLVHAIVEDNAGKLWISTNLGLSRLDPEKGTLRNFSIGDGLQGNQFFMQSFLKTRNGDIYFGGFNGFNSFRPENLRDNNFKIPVYITDFQVFNKSIIPGAPDAPLKWQISETKEIKLSWKQSVFSFSFAAVNYTFTAKNQYAYKLEGFDKEWNYVGNQRSATYTNLDPGEYVFKVKAANNDGIWNEKGTSVKIIITPPFWLTPLAYFIYFVLISIILYAIYREIRSRENLKSEIMYQKITAEKMTELNQMKLNFFTNISHELRTPLSLIIDPLRKITEEDVSMVQVKKLSNLAFRNSSRLLNLVNQLLNFRRFEGMLKLEPVEVNFIELIREISLAFAEKASARQINFSCKFQCEFNTVFIDQEKFNKILTNLISNAFKFTPNGGSIKVIASTYIQDGERMLEVRVKDTGPGIPPELKEKIFAIFFQVDNTPRFGMESSGIGLALAKELVQLHRGEIFEKGKFGEGADFIVRLSAGKKGKLSNVISLENKLPAHFLTEIHQKHAEETMIENTVKTEKDAPILLVVEDNDDLRTYIASTLSEMYQVELAAGGNEGYTKALQVIPDLVISDVMMEQGNGLELCKKLKTDERTSHIPVILLTAKQTDENKTEGYKTGADAYISKPFNSELLQACIKNILDNRSMLRSKFAGQIQPAGKSNSNPISDIDKEFLQKAELIILDNLSDPDFDIERFAEHLKMNRRQVLRKLKALINQTPQEYVISVKLNKAAELLLRKDKTISEVAYIIGFTEPANFTRAFTKMFGMSPKKYISEEDKILKKR